MRTLIIKELRENFKIAVMGIVLFTFLVLGSGLSYSRFIDAIASGTTSPTTNWNDWHPLTSDTVVAVPWFCCVFAVLLGWLQIHSEKHRDLWAFLIHRPIRPTHIFVAKVLSGLSIYVIAAGLPLFLFLLWMSMPGHVAAPFEWAMASPMAGAFLLGIVWYFAGMLTRLREARWYASRVMGIGVAIVALAPTLMLRQGSWQPAFPLVACAALLAVAAWGAFRSHGTYEPQPFLGKIALTISIAFGTTLAVMLAAILISYIFAGPVVQHPTQYVMLNDGAIYKQTYQGGETFQLQDLQGNVLKDVRGVNDLQARLAPGLRLIADTQAGSWQQSFMFSDATPDTVWFYRTRYGKLFGFDLRSRRLVGTIGPAGFSPGYPQSRERFEKPWALVPGFLGELHTATTLYFVDVHERTAQPVFKTPADDPILAISGGGVARSGNRAFRTQTAVLTRRSLQMIGLDSKITWRVPFELPRREYTDITISVLGTNGQFAVLLAPSNEAETKNPGTFPIYVTWFNRDQTVLKQTELPPLSSTRANALRDQSTSVFVFMSVLPPAGIVFFMFIQQALPWPLLLISLVIAALIIVPLGAWFGRRYNFSFAAQIAWAMFHILSGLPGFLAFLAVYDWPARERCPKCNKFRAVNRQQCEHCAADFPPPARDGTEIFEPLISRP